MELITKSQCESITGQQYSVETLCDILTIVLFVHWVSFELSSPKTQKSLYFVQCDMHQTKMCGFRKYPYPIHGSSLEIPRGWRVSKAKSFKEKYEANLKFLEGLGWGDSNPKSIHRGGIKIFWRNTIQRIGLLWVDISRMLEYGL